jgi:hypothetical protein
MTQPTKYEHKALNWLSLEDRAHCLKIFEGYNQNLSFLNGLTDTIDTELDKWVLHKDNLFVHEMDPITTARLYLKDAKAKISKGLVEKIEAHFTSTYNISFGSYLKTENEIKPFNSIVPIVDNILKECGKELVAAGKKNVTHQFQRVFYYPEGQPTIKDNKIYLPSYFGYEGDSGSKISLSENDWVVKALLDAISLSYLDKNIPPEDFKTLYKGWGYKIDVKETYRLTPGLTLKFYYNRKITICFPAKEDAVKFWNLFQLEGIAERNRINRP